MHTPTVHLLQDLCVKIDSTEGIVLLVLEIQREEELIAQAIKEKKVKQVQQELQKMQVQQELQKMQVSYSSSVVTCSIDVSTS